MLVYMKKDKSMKKGIILLFIAVTLLSGFSLADVANGFSLSDVSNAIKQVNTPKTSKSTETQTQQSSSLSDSTVTSGLKETLNLGVDYALKELSKDGGYLNNALVKIALPQNLQTAEKFVRKAGGNKIADDLIASMNKSATQAVPKTATIFANTIKNMKMEDVQKILTGGKDATTEYFKAHTTKNLTKAIQPIVEKTMQNNSVASYYSSFNKYYKEYGKTYVDNSAVMGYAKKFGVDSYLPGSDEDLNGYVTSQAINGLFKMIAVKEAEIRKNPAAQTTSLLKQLFGK